MAYTVRKTFNSSKKWGRNIMQRVPYLSSTTVDAYAGTLNSQGEQPGIL